MKTAAILFAFVASSAAAPAVQTPGNRRQLPLPFINGAMPLPGFANPLTGGVEDVEPPALESADPAIWRGGDSTLEAKNSNKATAISNPKQNTKVKVKVINQIAPVLPVFTGHTSWLADDDVPDMSFASLTGDYFFPAGFVSKHPSRRPPNREAAHEMHREAHGETAEKKANRPTQIHNMFLGSGNQQSDFSGDGNDKGNKSGNAAADQLANGSRGGFGGYGQNAAAGQSEGGGVGSGSGVAAGGNGGHGGMGGFGGKNINHGGLSSSEYY